MAQFKQGNSGRPKGAKGKAPSKLKEQIQLLLDDNMQMVQDDLDRCEPHIRIKLMIDLMGYVLPKQKSIEATVNNISEMSPAKIKRLEEMDELLIEIKAEQSNPKYPF